jgi:hypothetical protein
MKIVHVTKTLNGSYFLVDASGKEAGFAPTSTVPSEQEVRATLGTNGFADAAIERALTELRETGQTMLTAA